MIEASEKRQQTELAFRIAEAYNTMRAQRNADLQKVDSVLGAMQNGTNAELLRAAGRRSIISSAQNRGSRTMMTHAIWTAAAGFVVCAGLAPVSAQTPAADRTPNRRSRDIRSA